MKNKRTEPMTREEFLRKHKRNLKKMKEEKKFIRDFLIGLFSILFVGYPTLYLLLAIANTFR